MIGATVLAHGIFGDNQGPSLYYVSKDGVGGVRKMAILRTFSTIYADVEWVGGSVKVQKYADVL